MKKTAIFEDVISVMSHDSSTIKDRKGCDPDRFREKMTDDMTDDMTYDATTSAARDIRERQNNLNVSPKKKICLTGFRDKKLEKKYDVLPMVTKDCELLVCKSFEKETYKIKNAKKLGIRIVLFDELE